MSARDENETLGMIRTLSPSRSGDKANPLFEPLREQLERREGGRL